MYISKETPGSVSGYEFDGKPVDVPDDLAGELLTLAPGEFTQAPAPAARASRAAAPAMPDDKD